MAIHLIDSTVDDSYTWPSEESILTCQQRAKPNVTELVRDEHNRIWLPQDKQMRAIIYVAAHSWLGGHRSSDRTVKVVQELFFGDDLSPQIANWTKNCIHCISAKGSKKMRRPMGEHLVAERPAEVLHLDFLFVSRSGKFNNVLVIVDSLSNYVFLYPTKGLTAAEAAAGLLLFSSLFKAPSWVVTDAGASFVSELFQSLATKMNTQHHVCTAYVHMANGKAERYVKLARDTLKVLLSESRMDPSDWHELIPVVSSILNDTPSERLNGFTPRTVFLGMSNPTPLELAINGGSSLTEVTKVPAYGVLVEKAVNERDSIIKEAQEAATEGRKVIRERNIEYHKKWTAKLPKLTDGDFCLVARAVQGAKMQFHWCGPYVVTGIQHEFVYKVKNITTDQEMPIHISRLWYYDGPLLGSSKGIEEQAQYLDKGYFIEKILDLEYIGTTPNFTIKWEGLEESSKEPAQVIFEDAEEFVLEFIRKDGRDKLMKRLCKYLKLNYEDIIQGKA